MQKITEFAIQYFSWPRLVGLFLLLATPMVFAPFMSDDYFHLLMLGSHPPLPHPADGSLYGLFSFINNDAASRQLLINQGVLPWWTGDNFYFKFWRPLAEITHRVDYTLAPQQPMFAHLHNMAWFVALGGVLYRLYSHIAPVSAVAVLAIVIFMLNGNHAPVIEWVANRNALLSACFAFLALYAHSLFRTGGDYRYYLLALLCLPVALLAGESAVAIGGFFFAWALLLDRAGFARGFAWLLPYALIVLAWFAVYRHLGFGANGSGMHYVDAVSMPGAFLMALLERLPVYVLAGLTIIPAEVYPGLALLAPSAEAYALPLVLLLLVLLFVLCYPLIKNERVAQFFLLGAVLAIVPFCSLVNQDRLLLIPGVGFSYLVAHLIYQIYRRGLQPFLQNWRNRGLRFVAALLVLMHLVLSPFYLVAASTWIHADARRTQQALTALPDDSVAAEHLVILKGPMVQSALLKPVRQLAGLAYPEHVLMITTPAERLTVERLDERHLRFERSGGFVAGFEQSFRDLGQKPFAEGDVVQTAAMRLTIVRINNAGMPLVVEGSLHSAPEDYRFLVYRAGQGLQPVTLPSVGGKKVF